MPGSALWLDICTFQIQQRNTQTIKVNLNFRYTMDTVKRNSAPCGI